MDIVRWGIVSTAHINRRVIPMIHASRRGKLVAVASRDLEKGKAYAAGWNIPRTFGSYEEMLSSDEIDAVYISLPNHLHCEWSVRAMQAGKHVLCEKPFAISVEEAEKMIRTRDETGTILAEAFMYRHHPQTKLVGEWIRDGRLGEITLVQGIFSFTMQNKDTNVRMVSAYGGGALWDIGIYPMSFAQYIYAQPPTSVTAVQWVGETGVDESFAAQMDYGGGQTAQFGCSFRIPFAASMTIHGTLGRFEINRPFTRTNEKGSQLIYTPVDGSSQKIKVKKIDPYLAEIEDMQAAILDGKKNLVRLSESLDHIRTARALIKAAETKQIVHLG
jgi:D-xylose 1-dehydrogenase (NADP+, D-xylono-1,5-lactone-forming)